MIRTAPAPAPPDAPSRASRDAMALLAAGVPLTLLLDLAGPVRSADLLRTEPGDSTWALRRSA